MRLSVQSRLVLFCGLIASLLLSMQSPCFAADRTRVLDVPGGRILITFEGAKLDLSDEAVVGWVRDCARAITSYYGRFPLKKTVVRIQTTSGSGVGFSTATSDDEDNGLVEVPLGRHTTMEDLTDDWVLTHEMVHLNFPLVTDNRTWIAEGMATYVEPLARLQAGSVSSSEVWNEFVRDIPQGLPERGDRGLDFTNTWERKYWGGALFFFVADLEIRSRTNNRKGLQDALAAIAAAGGHIGSHWTVEECFAVGDRATGVPVLQALYREMRAKPVYFDLAQIFRSIGVERRDGNVSFRRDAPLAAVRRAISTGSPSGYSTTQLKSYQGVGVTSP